MNRIQNKVQLIGNLGKDPEIKHYENGSVANFSLATQFSYKNKDGEKIEQTDWHNIVMNNKLAEIAEKYLAKGSKIAVEGRLTTRTYEKDGEKRYVAEVKATEMLMLSTTERSSSSQAGDPGPQEEMDTSGFPQEEVNF